MHRLSCLLGLLSPLILAWVSCTPPSGPQAHLPDSGLPGPGPVSDTSGPSLPEGETLRIESLGLSLAALKKSLESGGEIRRQRVVARGDSAPGSDVSVRNRVRSRLQDDPGVPAMSLDVEMDGGRVILTGRVGRIEELQRALLAAFSVPEVSEVTSRILVEPDDGSGAIQGEAVDQPVAR